LRIGGGQVWEDHTLHEWDPDLANFYLVDLQTLVYLVVYV
jgi:hypothetical protein